LKQVTGTHNATYQQETDSSVIEQHYLIKLQYVLSWTSQYVLEYYKLICYCH